MEPIVETAYGRIAGRRRPGAYAFLGVRYGGPTGGKGRFRPPRPPRPWAGVRDATAFGPMSPPTLSAGERAQFSRSAVWSAYAGYDRGVPFSEDCLCVNVWTPGPGDGARRPVLVWLHGGAFAWGSGSSSFTDGDALAGHHDVVVVSVNHRLGVLGYLDLREAGPEWHGSEAAGLLDLALALEWVRENISSFGGDPGNVTLVGHSGGGSKVASLMAMPAARGLYHRAIIQSGVMALKSITRDESTRVAAAVLDDLAVTPADATRLQDVPVKALTAAGGRHRYRPVTGSAALPVHPWEPVAPAAAGAVPLLIGTTKDDSALFNFDMDPAFADLAEADLCAMVASLRVIHLPYRGGPDGATDPDRIPDVVAAIDEASRARPGRSRAAVLVAIATAKLVERTELVIARKKAAGTGSVHRYRFDYEVPMPPDSPLAGERMAPHGVELPFVFDIARRVPFAGPRPERTALGRAMARYWTEFARAGRPAPADLPRWPAYDGTAGTTMVFDTEIRLDTEGQSAP